MSDRDQLTITEQRAFSYMDEKLDAIARGGRPPLVYVVRYRYGPHAPILGVYGRVSDAEAAARADATATGRPLHEYVTDGVEFHGTMQRRGKEATA